MKDIQVHYILLPTLCRQIATTFISYWLLRKFLFVLNGSQTSWVFWHMDKLFTAAFSLVLLFTGTCLRRVLYTKQFTLSTHLFIGSPIRWFIYHLYLLNKCGRLQAWNTLDVIIVSFKWYRYFTMLFISFSTN